MRFRRVPNPPIPVEPVPVTTDDREPSGDELLHELERVVAHPIFRKSEILRNILTFLVRAFIDSPAANHKEHEIATSALGRSDDFDPRLDSTVRVHTARLRTRLTEYYAGDGAGDPVIFEIPKGAYQLAARYQEALPAVIAEPLAQRTGNRKMPAGLWGWIVAAVAVAVAIFLWVQPRRTAPPEALGVFWADFGKPGEENALVFSNHRLVGSAVEGLRYAPAEPVAPALMNESYTGTGEVYGIGALSTLFAQYWRPIHIKRGRLLTWDDARQQNLIFVGGPDVNRQLGDLPSLQRFRFDSVTNGSTVWSSWITDAQARPGQPARYGNSSRPYTFDHAVIARMRLATNRHMLLLAGTATVGTQGAVDFVTREETTRLLLTSVKALQPRAVPGFEALLRVKVSDGVPVHAEMLAVHLRK